MPAADSNRHPLPPSLCQPLLESFLPQRKRRRIDDLEIVEIEGIPVTSVRQTLADMCAVVDLDIVERAAESALRRNLVDERALREFAESWAMYRHGAPGLRDVL